VDAAPLLVTFTTPNTAAHLIHPVLLLLQRDDEVYWVNKPKECLKDSLHPVLKINCPHAFNWFYTPADGKLGLICQQENTTTPLEATIKATMLK
jgi:hypothetical protein